MRLSELERVLLDRLHKLDGRESIQGRWFAYVTPHGTVHIPAADMEELADRADGLGLKVDGEELLDLCEQVVLATNRTAEKEDQ